MILKCENVRGVRDSNDVKTAEAVSLKSVVIEGAQDHFVVSVNITFEDPRDWGTYVRDGLYSLELTKQG